jgi:hypothetical protein
VYLKELQITFLDNELTYLLCESGSNGKNFRILGEIIRTVFDGRKVPNEKDKQLLTSL